MISQAAVEELIGALIEGTRAGSVRWTPADVRGDTFIARRSSGTVTLQGDFGQGLTGRLRLVVRDRHGQTVDEIATSLGGGVGQSALIDLRLRELASAVQDRLANTDSALRALAAEFRRSR